VQDSTDATKDLIPSWMTYPLVTLAFDKCVDQTCAEQ